MGITFFSSSQIGITENQKKILILNHNNFFSRQLKKSERSKDWKFIHLYAPQSWWKSVKNCDTFFRFSESTIKMTKRCPIEYQIAINSNIYLSKQSRSVILNWASLLHCLQTGEESRQIKGYTLQNDLCLCY